MKCVLRWVRTRVKVHGDNTPTANGNSSDNKPQPNIQQQQALVSEKAMSRVVVVGGSYAGVELSCNLATELGGGRKGMGKVEVTLAAGSEVKIEQNITCEDETHITRTYFFNC